MAAPTFVSATATTFGSNTSPKTTASISVNVGDILVGVGAQEGQEASPTWDAAFTGGSLLWTDQQKVNVVNYTWNLLSSATAGSTTSFTTSLTRSSGTTSLWFGQQTFVFRNSDGIGASSKTNVLSGAPSLSLTTTQDNSAIVVVVADYSALDGTSRTWRTVNSITPSSGNGYETTYFRDSAHYAVYVAYYPDAGTAGAKTVGLTTPSTMKYSIAAIEVKGTAGGGGSFKPGWASRTQTIGGVF